MDSATGTISTPRDRLEAAREMLDAAFHQDDQALASAGHQLLLEALLERGDIRAIDIELAGRGELSARFPELVHGETAGWFRCLRALLDGDTMLAEGLVDQQRVAASASGTGDPQPDVAQVNAAQVNAAQADAVQTNQWGIIRWMQGRDDGLEESFLARRREHPEQPFWSAALVWLWLRQGRRAAAEALFDTLHDLEQIPRDRYWLSTITLLAESATQLGSEHFAGQLHQRLLPFADRLVPVGRGVAFWGTTARALGLLEERLGMVSGARIHLEQAVEITARLGAQAWLAEAQIELAEFAIRHELTDVPVYELLAEALNTSVSRGFIGLAARARRRPRIRVMGRFEVLSVDGVRAEWVSRKARELLKMLVAARGVARSREVYMDALWPGVKPSQLANRFSVAVSAIRRALDPQRLQPRERHVVVEDDSIRLDLSAVDVDLERFFAAAAAAGERADEGALRAAEGLYRGGAFPDEPYADWAVAVREHADEVWRALHR